MKLQRLSIVAACALSIGGGVALAQPPSDRSDAAACEGHDRRGPRDDEGNDESGHGGRHRGGHGGPGGFFMNPENAAKRVQMLTLMLGLDSTQQARVQQIVEQTVASFRQERDARQGSPEERPTPEQRTARRAAHEQLMDNAANQIAALLRPDQKVIFDRMRAVMAAHRQEMQTRHEERSERGPRPGRQEKGN